MHHQITNVHTLWISLLDPQHLRFVYQPNLYPQTSFALSSLLNDGMEMRRDTYDDVRESESRLLARARLIFSTITSFVTTSLTLDTIIHILRRDNHWLWVGKCIRTKPKSYHIQAQSCVATCFNDPSNDDIRRFVRCWWPEPPFRRVTHTHTRHNTTLLICGAHPKSTNQNQSQRTTSTYQPHHDDSLATSRQIEIR